MTAKHLNKKNSRQKKIVSVLTPAKEGAGGGGYERGIIRQFNQIQKDYSRLVDDVLKELNLVKGWIGAQAINKGNQIKSKFGL